MTCFFRLLLNLLLLINRFFEVKLEELGLKKSGIALLKALGLEKSGIPSLKALTLVGWSDNIILNALTTF